MVNSILRQWFIEFWDNGLFYFETMVYSILRQWLLNFETMVIKLRQRFIKFWDNGLFYFETVVYSKTQYGEEPTASALGHTEVYLT